MPGSIAALLSFAFAIPALVLWLRERSKRRALERALADAGRLRESPPPRADAQPERDAMALENIAEGVITVDQEGRVASMNAAAEHWTGWSRSAAKGRRLEQVFKVAPARDDAAAAAESESTLASRDGSTRHVSYRSASIVDAGGSEAGAVVTFRDVTGRREADAAQQRLLAAAQAAERTARQAQRELGIAHEKFAAFMTNFPYPAFIQDEHGNLAFMNAAGAASGASHGAAASRPQGVDAAMSETVSIPASDRHYFCIRFPLRVEGRQWLGTIAIDVSERIRAERALGERTAELETLFQSVPAPLWIARDSAGDEIIGNPAASDLSGLAHDAKASAGAWVFFREGRPVDRESLPIRTAIRERRVVHGTDMDIVRPDGTRRSMRVTAAPLFDAKGQVRGAVAAALDISQLKAYEAELERAVRRRDEFLAVLAHELRNPLAPIRNSVQILQRAPGDVDRVRRATAVIDRQTSQLVRLIDALLDVACISQGLVELDMAPRTVAAIVDGALDVVRERLEKTGHEIVVEHEAGDAVVLVDALRAEQILVNLLSNALKYSLPRTRVAIRSWRDGDVARIAVTDQGQGIPPEFLSEIFTMFARPGLEARSRISGMGVGLALARQLAEQQGGSIDAASEGRGRGATFTVAFPLAERSGDVIAA